MEMAKRTPVLVTSRKRRNLKASWCSSSAKFGPVLGFLLGFCFGLGMLAVISGDYFWGLVSTCALLSEALEYFESIDMKDRSILIKFDT